MNPNEPTAAIVGNLHAGLTALAVSKNNNEGMYASAQKEVDQFSILERFPAPIAQPQLNPAVAEQEIRISTPEFTSLCPITGQPDFATIKIRYNPNQWCVESKALKLYLLSFRNRGEFHEQCINRITNDLARLLNPNFLEVIGEFTPRGGIPIWPTSTFYGNGEAEFVANQYANDVDPAQQELSLPYNDHSPGGAKIVPHVYDNLVKFACMVLDGGIEPGDYDDLVTALRADIPLLQR